MIARVEWRDGALQIVDPDEEARAPTLLPTEDPDVFPIAPGVRESGQPVTFNRRADGRVFSMFMAIATMVRSAPWKRTEGDGQPSSWEGRLLRDC